MARPKKSTVDYFPHDTCHGSTMQILESRWGNDGYAFWFKLLELLGSHENHVIDCRKPAEWEFLTAKTRVDSNTASSILDMLAKLEAIDATLWTDYRVVFCPKFLARIEDAYRKRKNAFPSLNSVYVSLNIPFAEFSTEETPQKEVSGGINRERERERERKEKKKPALSPEQLPASEPSEQAGCESGDSLAAGLIRQAVAAKRERLRELFPHANIDVETERLCQKYRDGPVMDAHLLVLTWFQKIPVVAGVRQRVATMTPEQIEAHNAAVEAEFLGGVT